MPNEKNNIRLITPCWPVKPQIKAVATTRIGGVSEAPFDTCNLALHVGDNENHVEQNRQRLQEQLALAQPPYWLNQVHGTRVVDLPAAPNSEADASYTNQANTPCVVMTADCLPVLFCNIEGTEVAAAHAGWRGLAAGVLEQTVNRFESTPSQLMAWLGPAISLRAFEVGDEVKDAFIQDDPTCAKAFQRGNVGKWYADIYELARVRLHSAGVAQIYAGDYCTFTDKSLFYSYRRDGKTGRMASLIWITP